MSRLLNVARVIGPIEGDQGLRPFQVDQGGIGLRRGHVASLVTKLHSHFGLWVGGLLEIMKHLFRSEEMSPSSLLTTVLGLRIECSWSHTPRCCRG